MDRPLAIALANDFDIIVLGLVHLLEPYADRVRVTEIALRGAPVATPVDVVLVDVFGRVDVGEEIRALVAEGNVGHVAIFAWQLDRAQIDHAFELGVTGYLAKSLTAEELVDAIERVAAGERVVAGHAPTEYRAAGRDWPGRSAGLSERESEIVILVAEGHTNADIAAALHLSLNSVKTHIRSAYRKLGVERRAQAVRTVLELGLAQRSLDRDPSRVLGRS